MCIEKAVQQTMNSNFGIETVQCRRQKQDVVWCWNETETAEMGLETVSRIALGNIGRPGNPGTSGRPGGFLLSCENLLNEAIGVTSYGALGHVPPWSLDM